MACKAVIAVVFLLSAGLSVADAAKVSPVQKVIQLIDDMAGKITKELNEEDPI